MGQKRLITFSFLNDRNKLRIRFKHNGKRIPVSTSLDYSESNIELAKQLTHQIQTDIKKNQFDDTLNRYKEFVYTPLKSIQKINGNGSHKPVQEPYDKALIANFELWVKNYRQKDCDKHIDYHATRAMLKRWGLFKIENGLACLNKETFGISTYNRRLKLVHDFYKWGVKHKGYKLNPFEDVSRKQKYKDAPENIKRDPFTDDEVNNILYAIKNDSHVPKCSRYPHSLIR